MRIAVLGDVDLSNVLALEGALAALITESPAVIEVDLTEVTFLSCDGLALMVQAWKAAGSRFALVGASPVIRRLLDALQLQVIFEWTDEKHQK
jgi:anti-anti-sigma factor